MKQIVVEVELSEVLDKSAIFGLLYRHVDGP